MNYQKYLVCWQVMVTCRLCLSESELFCETEKPSNRYFRCKTCLYIQQDQSQWLSSEEEKQRYQTHNNSPANQGYVEFLQSFIDQISDFLPANGQVLDYGCGTSPVLGQLLELKGLKVFNYDPYFFPDNSLLNRNFDLITSCEVFEHLCRPREVLQQLESIVVDRGILAIRTEMLIKGKDFASWHYHRDPTHVGFFCRQSWQWWCKNHPWELLDLGEKYVVLRKK